MDCVILPERSPYVTDKEGIAYLVDVDCKGNSRAFNAFRASES